MNQNLVKLKANNNELEITLVNDAYEILNAWYDKSVSFHFKKRQNLTSLKDIQFPEQLVAIYNMEEKSLEFIYGITDKDSKTNQRDFEFIYKGNIF